MGFLKSLGRVLEGPVAILHDWAESKVCRGEAREMAEIEMRKTTHSSNEQIRVKRASQESDIRAAEAKAAAEQRVINAQADADIRVKQTEAEIESRKNREAAELEIRMNTEIQRINAETEQWQKDQEFQRMKNIANAVYEYKEKLTEMNIRMIRCIGEMDIDLRRKAQDLIAEKTTQYQLIQDKAYETAEAELERVIEKFSGNEKVLDIMIARSDEKCANIINNTKKFLEELSLDIQRMNENINYLTQQGQSSIDKIIGGFDQIQGIQGPSNKALDNIQDVDATEVK